MRNFFHVAISLLMWGVFGYYWFLVSRDQMNRTSFQAVAILAVITIVGVLLTLWWVSHNKKLAQRNRRKGSPDTVPETFDADTLGRKLERPEIGALQAAQVIDIDLGDSSDQKPPTKIYTIAEQGGL